MGEFKNMIDNIDFEQLSKEIYEEDLCNLNNYSYWYPKVKDCGLNIVDSKVYKIPYDMWLEFHNLETKESKEKVINYLKELLNNDKEIKHSGMFNIKNGAFSNKFNAADCIVHFDDIPEKFCNIQYFSQCYDTGGTTELVVRQNINYNINKVPTIYNGLPLRTEFRVFVDFDNERVLYIVNYWDYNYCYKHLCLTDQIIFDYMRITLEEDYKNNKDIVVNLVQKYLIMHNKTQKDKLTGIWSVDIMKNECTFYLIDMAIAERSAYWDSSVLL